MESHHVKTRHDAAWGKWGEGDIDILCKNLARWPLECFVLGTLVSYLTPVSDLDLAPPNGSICGFSTS